jgi:putative lipoprotein (rSAM/lipoprotein system)
MRKFFTSGSGSLIRLLLILLGFPAACDLQGTEYGVPSAEFKVKGIVKDLSSGAVVKGIQVAMDYDTVKVSPDGSYTVKARRFPEDQDFTLRFRDVDGEANGEYQDLDTLVKFKNPVFKGGDGHWYEGSTETTLDINLKPKI